MSNDAESYAPLTTEEYVEFDPTELDADEVIDGVLAFGKTTFGEEGGDLSVMCLPFKEPHGCSAWLLRNISGGDFPDGPRHLSVLTAANGEVTRFALESLFTQTRKRYLTDGPCTSSTPSSSSNLRAKG
jgi:hypothetical protein